MALFVICRGDDWDGLYVDGKLVLEGHSLRDTELLEAAYNHGPVTGVGFIEADTNWLHDVGSLPDNLSDVEAI